MRIEIIFVICFIGIPVGLLILYFIQNRNDYSDEIATRFRSIPPLRSEALRHPCRSVATLVTLCCQNSSF